MVAAAPKTYRKYHFSRLLFWTLTTFITASIFPYAHAAFAAQVTIAWNANTEPDLAGYKIYYKTGSPGSPYDGFGASEGNSPIIIELDPNGDRDTSDGDLSDPTAPVFTIHGLSDTETTYSVITAYDAHGNESGFSNELLLHQPMSPSIESISHDGCISELSTSQIQAIVYDPLKGDLSYSWLPLNGGTVTGSGASVYFRPQDNGPHPCPYQIKLTVTSSANGLSAEVHIDICATLAGDFDSDGDVDGTDLATFAADFGRTDCSTTTACEGDFDSDANVDGTDLATFAADFGRTDCSTTSNCEGDFDSDADADGSDLATFAANFGRTDGCTCP